MVLDNFNMENIYETLKNCNKLFARRKTIRSFLIQICTFHITKATGVPSIVCLQTRVGFTIATIFYSCLSCIIALCAIKRFSVVSGVH